MRATPAQLAALCDGPGEDGRGPAVRDVLGAALHARRSLLLYGPSGSGKTPLARKLGRLLPGPIAVPYAMVVGRQVDPPVRSRAAPGAGASGAPAGRAAQLRYALGRLPASARARRRRADAATCSDLRYDGEEGMYHAPPHLQAGGGMLVIDDVGRQRIPAGELLNRLIAPARAGCDDLLSCRAGTARACR